jgi:hypothetical protein
VALHFSQAKLFLMGIPIPIPIPIPISMAIPIPMGILRSLAFPDFSLRLCAFA